MLLLCASTLFACGDRHAFDLDTSSTSAGATTGPEPGAPDEFCEPLDPRRVYLRHYEYGYSLVAAVDLEAPDRVCIYPTLAYSEPEPPVMRVEPETGLLLRLRGTRVERVRNEWVTREADGTVLPQGPWQDWAEAAAQHVEMRGTILDADGEVCEAADLQGSERGLLWGGGTWFSACGKTVRTVDGVVVADPPLTLATTRDGFAAVGMLGTSPVYCRLLPAQRGGSEPIFVPDAAGFCVGASPMPFEEGSAGPVLHVAARPKQGEESTAVDAAVLVAVDGMFGGVVTEVALHRVTMRSDGIAFEGEYPQTMLSMYEPAIDAAIDGDGALYLLVPDDAEQEDGPLRVIRGAVGGTVEVVGEWDFERGHAGLFSLGVGRL